MVTKGDPTPAQAKVIEAAKTLLAKQGTPSRGSKTVEIGSVQSGRLVWSSPGRGVEAERRRQWTGTAGAEVTTKIFLPKNITGSVSRGGRRASPSCFHPRGM